MKRTVVLLFLVAFLIPCFLHAQEDSPYGICAHLQRGEEHNQMPQNLELMKQAGIRWVRADFSWNSVESKDGNWNFEHLDRVVAETKKNGLQILPILDYDVPWATPAYKHLDQWLVYVEKIVSRYKNDIKYWEVWNEENLQGFWREKPDGANYKILLEATYKKIKEIDPNLVVLYGGTAGIPFEFIEKSFEAGAAKYFDVFNIHPYRSGMTSVQASLRYEEDIKKLVGIMKKYDVDQKKIWITEFGWATPPGQDRSSQAVLVAARKILDPEGANWPVAVLLDANYPTVQAYTQSSLRSVFPDGYDIRFIKLPDLKTLDPTRYKALYLPPTENFPTPYLNDIVDYVSKGGNLFLSGGVPLYYQTEFDNKNTEMLVQKREGARPDDDRRRLRIGWSAWWTDKEKKTPEFAKIEQADEVKKILEGYTFQAKASRFLNDNLLKEGDRLIPILLGKEKDFKGIAAGIFKFDSDMKGAVVVNTIMVQDVSTTEEDQAIFLPQAILLSLRFGIERYFWYEFQAPERDDFDKEHHFGIVHQQLDPKPAYHAYSTLTRACPAGAQIDPTQPLIQGNLCVVSWTRKDGTKAWAVWAPSGETEVSVKIGPGFRAAADLFGKTLPITEQTDKITFGPGVYYFTGPETMKFQ